MDILRCFMCVMFSFGFLAMLLGMIKQDAPNYLINTVTFFISAAEIILSTSFTMMYYKTHELYYLIFTIPIVVVCAITIWDWMEKTKTGNKVLSFPSKK